MLDGRNNLSLTRRITRRENDEVFIFVVMLAACYEKRWDPIYWSRGCSPCRFAGVTVAASWTAAGALFPRV
jgi:hypothetical protein